MRWKPHDAVAFVSGVSSGIGRELLSLLVQRGTTVIGNARRADRLQLLKHELDSQ